MSSLIFSCESVGTHGETYAVGCLLADHEFVEIQGSAIYFACDSARAIGNWADHERVAARSESLTKLCNSTQQVAEYFWQYWINSGKPNLFTDQIYPVAANMLQQLKKLDGTVVYDINSYALSAGIRDLIRLPTEKPEGHPIADVRLAARKLATTRKILGLKGGKW